MVGPLRTRHPALLLALLSHLLVSLYVPLPPVPGQESDAARNKLLWAGDRIVAINGTSLTGLAYHEIKGVLRPALADSLKLELNLLRVSISQTHAASDDSVYLEKTRIDFAATKLGLLGIDGGFGELEDDRRAVPGGEGDGDRSHGAEVLVLP